MGSATVVSAKPDRTHIEAPVHEMVEARFPGVRLESKVQGWVYLEDYASGIEAYQALAEPSAKDDRWLGVCYFQRTEDLAAVEALYRAVARGDDAARINLAHVLRFVERGEDAVSELKSVHFDRLNDYDKVFYLRVTSIHEETNGNLKEALRAAEEAWKRIQGLPEYAILAPSILAQLGILHSRIGRAQRALWCLDRGLQTTDGIEQHKVRLRRVAILVALGRVTEALAELEAVRRLDLPETFLPEIHFLLGEVQWVSGNAASASRELEACVERSASLQFTYEEFVARLALTALNAHLGEVSTARAHLSRAQSLIMDKSDRLAYRFREIELHLRTGEYSVEHGLQEYTALDEQFGQMGLLQEKGLVKLHIAALLGRMGSKRATAVLDELQSLCVTLQNHAFLAKEWVLLTEYRREAKRTHAQLLGEASDILEVRTLGDERLVFAGDAVSIPLRRLVEVVAYFLEHKAVSLKKLMLDVFPDEKPRSAKSYFHQCRHQLKEHLSSVAIEYDAEAKLYRLKSEIDILWDVAEVRAGRAKGDIGVFLPSSGNDWALAVDHDLDRFRAYDLSS